MPKLYTKIPDADLAPRHIHNGDHVKAVIAVPNVGAGGTDALMTLDLYYLDGETALEEAKEVMIYCGATQYHPDYGTPEASVTFGTATKGTIVASGNGWCLARTSAAGEFDCTVTNSADETLYFWVETARQVSALGYACTVVGCVPDSAAWSA